MTTTDTMSTPLAGPHGTPHRALRRSTTDRVGAGVAGGLGEYFGVDPVLFRVLFATSAFFGGAGILAYLIAWAAIPEAGTEHAAIDGWMRSMRRRHIPFWAVAVLAGLLLWAVAFSWWAPGPVFPVIAVVVLLGIVLVRRDTSPTAPPPPASTAPPAPDAAYAPTGPVNLRKTAPDTAAPTWRAETRQWIAESREARRLRVRRAQPVRLTTLAVLLVTLTILGLADAVGGIVLPVYFFVTLGIVGAGLLIGLALRRTPWSLTPLLILAIIGTIAFAGSRASLHDGVGQRTWTPTTTASTSYRLAFGQGVLDLRSLPAPTAPTTLAVTQAAGQVRIIAPKSMNLAVHVHLRFGEVRADGIHIDDGAYLDPVVPPLAGATGAPLIVNVELSDGQVSVERR